MILIIGLPNSGKTTLSSKYANVIHYDDYMDGDKVIELMHESEDEVVIEGIYNRRKGRARLLSVCPHGERKVCIWLETPVEECLRRERAYRKRPDSIVLHHARTFEEPTYDEGWDEIIIIKTDTDF